jgi:peptide/nickel transport system permease protein
MMLGAVAGFYGGRVDLLLSRINEFMLTIPQLPILLIISAILLKQEVVLPLPGFVNRVLSSLLLAPEREAQKVVVLVLILVIFGWLGAFRLMRGMALTLSKQDFVEALRAAGASDARIIFRHIIPNGLAPILVNASLALGQIIVLESALSFLGLGVQDPTPTWGNMLDFARGYMFQHPWLPLVPGIPLVIVSMGFNFIGDGLRDALDPRLKR